MEELLSKAILGDKDAFTNIILKNELTNPTIKTSFPITIYNADDNLKLIIQTNQEIMGL